MFYLPKRIFNVTIEDIIVYLYRNYTIKGEFDMQNKDKKKVTSKQVVAMAGVILLVLLYVVTLIVSIIDKSASGQWFMICLMATVAIPQRDTFKPLSPRSARSLAAFIGL